jgi:hypothetical protein
MGSAVGAALRAGGVQVVTTLAGRSERTARLARDAGLECLPDLASVLGASDVVFSIAPPDRAGTIADRVADEAGDATPLVADLNAVSPATTRRIEAKLRAAGIDLVAVLAQALLAASANGVLDHVVDDLGELADHAGLRLARSTTKAHRYVGEMREIAATQAAAGLTPDLFEAMATVYEALAARPLAQQAPEDVSADTELPEVLRQLAPEPGR